MQSSCTRLQTEEEMSLGINRLRLQVLGLRSAAARWTLLAADLPPDLQRVESCATAPQSASTINKRNTIYSLVFLFVLISPSVTTSTLKPTQRSPASISTLSERYSPHSANQLSLHSWSRYLLVWKKRKRKISAMIELNPLFPIQETDVVLLKSITCLSVASVFSQSILNSVLQHPPIFSYI